MQNDSYEKAIFIRIKPVKGKRYLNNYLFPNLDRIIGSKRFLFLNDTDHINQTEIILAFTGIAYELIEFLIEEDLLIDVEDITQRLIKRDFRKSHVLLKMKRDNEYREHFDRFFEYHLSVDLILDKILENGLDSLSYNELEFLNKASAEL